jgi:hypothetical protein
MYQAKFFKPSNEKYEKVLNLGGFWSSTPRKWPDHDQIWLMARLKVYTKYENNPFKIVVWSFQQPNSFLAVF